MLIGTCNAHCNNGRNGKAAQFGILIKSAESLETAHSIDTVVLDKTGTCTEGKPELISAQAFGDFDVSELKKLCGSAESGSSHPLAKAVTGHCKTNGIELSPAESYTETAGGGISAVVEGRNVLIGNKRLMDNSGVDISMVEETAHAHADNGEIPLYAAVDGKLAGILFIADKIKETSAEAIEGFKKAGIETVMLTGDNEKTARAIQKSLAFHR